MLANTALATAPHNCSESGGMKKTLRTHKVANLDAGHWWAALRRAPLRKSLRLCAHFVRHFPALMPLLFAPRGSNLRRLITARPEIVGIVLTRYIASNWDTATRIARLIDHHKTVAQIGGVVDFSPDIIIDIVPSIAIDPRYRITLDQARWLLREGSLVLSLWDGIDRIFHLGFCLSTEGGKRVAYIGSMQGRRDIELDEVKFDLLGHYRQFTKTAGMRPRDFLVEVFRIFCRLVDVTEIRAVSDENHPQRKLVPDVKLSYDEIWSERGGSRAAGEFFILPVVASRRSNDDIPAKRRSQYARRYSMLDAVETELAEVLRPGVELAF
jgi:uncharacterized protein VirK/YbjX